MHALFLMAALFGASVDINSPISWDTLGNITLQTNSNLTWPSGGSLQHSADGFYAFTDNAGDNAATIQIGTGTAASNAPNGFAIGTRNNANAVVLCKPSAGSFLGIQTGSGQWAPATSSSWGLNGNNGGVLGMIYSGTVLQLNGAGGVQIQNAGIWRSGSVTPNSNVVGSIGDLYTWTGGGTSSTLWVKESGSATNTGWVFK